RIWGFRDAALGDDGRDVAMRSYIEGGILNRDAVRRNLLAGKVRDLASSALLDWYVIAVGSGEIDRGPRRGHVKGNAVLPRQHCHCVCTDFVGDIAISGNAVGADDYGANLALLHHGSGHVVGDYRCGNTILGQLPGGEARTLQEGTCFVGENVNLL